MFDKEIKNLPSKEARFFIIVVKMSKTSSDNREKESDSLTRIPYAEKLSGKNISYGDNIRKRVS